MLGTMLGPWLLERELGTGGMGTVYLATDGERRAAVKVVHPHLLAHPGYFKRFLREAEIGRAISHPNLIRVFDVDALQAGDRTVHFLVMEYVEGQTLRGLLRELGRVPEELCRHICREVARGLVAIHANGVVHRDLKPENVLITSDHTIKIMDLGVARLDQEARLSEPGLFLGSLDYAAPEQFQGGAEIDGRADLHALGAVLYELATGEHPFRGQDIESMMRRVLAVQPTRVSERNPQLSPFFEEVVHKLLAKEPADRFADAAQLLRVVEEGEASTWWRERARELRLAARRPLRRARVPRETSLYGRAPEIERLTTLYGRARQGEGCVVLIEGEAGIGKTRLVDEFACGLEQKGEEINFLLGSYPPAGAATAAGAWTTAYREHLGTVSEAIASYLTATPLLVPAFAALLKGDATPHGCEPLTKESLQTCFVEMTAALAAERPTVIVVEDLHDAPGGGLAIFAALALSVPGQRVLLVGTSRPGLPREWLAGLSRLDHVHRLELQRLAPADVGAILRDVLRSPQLAEELADRITRESDGNPFFVFEILRELREAKVLTEGPEGVWVRIRREEQLPVSPSIRALVAARLAALSEEERELLDIASCVGFEWDPRLVCEAAGLEWIPVLKLLARVERHHRIVRSVGTRYIFDHHLLHDAIYQGLAPPLRAAYHTEIGTALEKRELAAEPAREQDGRLAVDLCEHFRRGGRVPSALRYLERALDHLQCSYLNERALDLVQWSLAQGETPADRRFDLLLRAADLHELTGQTAEARGSLEQAIVIAQSSQDAARGCRARARLGKVLAASGHLEAARQELERAVDEGARSADRDAEVTARLRLGDCLHEAGKPAHARACYEEAARLALSSGNAHAAANATGNLGLLAWQEGRLDEARERYEQCLAVACRVGDRRAEATAIGALGLLHDETGRFEEAARHHERHLALAREIGYRRGVSIALANLGDSMRMLGRLEEAVRCFEHSRRIAAETGDPGGVVATRINLAATRRHLGESAEALRELATAIRESREIGDRRQEALTLFQMGWAHAELGHMDHAERAAADALAIFRDLQLGPSAGWGAYLLGTLMLRSGKPEEARPRLEEAIAVGRETGVIQLVALGRCQLARLGAIDVAEAEEELTRALPRLAPHERVEAFHALWKVSGRPEQLAKAREMAEELLAFVPGGRRSTMVAGVTIFREVYEG